MRKSEKGNLITPGYILTYVLVTSLFFLWALPNNLNDILIPQFMKSFELSRLKAGLVQSAFYLGYFLFAMPAALIMDRYGYKWILVVVHWAILAAIHWTLLFGLWIWEVLKV